MFWLVVETSHNALLYIDIEGVTGSIPVSPTTFRG